MTPAALATLAIVVATILGLLVMPPALLLALAALIAM